MSRKPVCPECGSDNVLLDAWASWNHDKQAFEVAATFENGTCEDCASDTSDGHFRHAEWKDDK
jgi:hypothetical protein